MTFIRHQDPLTTMGIGHIAMCETLIKELNGVILSEKQSQSYKRSKNDRIWDPSLFNTIGGYDVVIGIDGNYFEIYKNTSYPEYSDEKFSGTGYKGQIRDLYRILSLWCNELKIK
jgi:hypothetical protein